jgi:hypothetical protein
MFWLCGMTKCDDGCIFEVRQRDISSMCRKMAKQNKRGAKKYREMMSLFLFCIAGQRGGQRVSHQQKRSVSFLSDTQVLSTFRLHIISWQPSKSGKSSL